MEPTDFPQELRHSTSGVGVFPGSGSAPSTTPFSTGLLLPPPLSMMPAGLSREPRHPTPGAGVLLPEILYVSFVSSGRESFSELISTSLIQNQLCHWPPSPLTHRACGPKKHPPHPPHPPHPLSGHLRLHPSTFPSLALRYQLP